MAEGRGVEIRSANATIAQQHAMLPVIHRVKTKLRLKDVERLCFEPCELDDRTFSAVLDALSGPIQQKRNRKIVACWILSRAKLTRAQRASACASVGDLVCKGRAGRRTFRSFFSSLEVTCFGAVGLVLMNAAAIAFSNEASIWLVLPAVVIALGLYAAAMFLASKFTLSVYEPATVALGSLQTRESVDILASLCTRAMGANNVLYTTGLPARAKSARSARAALDVALPALTEDDYGLMKANTVPNLLRLFEWYAGPMGGIEWTVERSSNLFRALETVGDRRALPVLRRFIAREFEDSMKRRQAQRVLEVLEARERNEQSRAVLLRGSAVNEQSDCLLRAASGNSAQSNPSLLVRPSNGTEQPY